MICKACGKEIDDQAAACIYCGKTVPKEPEIEDTTNSIWWAVIGFFVPVAGLVMWAMCKDTQPVKAKKAGIGALVGMGASVLAIAAILLLYFGFFILMYMMMFIPVFIGMFASML